MILEEVTALNYQEIIREPWHGFASAPFNELNADKTERVHYLLFKDSKYRLGLIAGQVEGTLSSPFSAPFGGYSPLSGDVSIQSIEEAVNFTERWARSAGLQRIKLTLPPLLYDENFISKVSNVLQRSSFGVEFMDLNFHFDLTLFSDGYRSTVWKNARKNLNISFDRDLSFELGIAESEKEKAFGIIQHNRSIKGKPLRMSFQQVVATSKIIPVDYFLVKTMEKEAVASAIVFTVAPKIALVVYWGDIPDFPKLKVMNFLSYKIFEYYKQKDFRIVDIGISTENSVPNYGLMDFKESLACTIQPRLTFIKNLI